MEALVRLVTKPGQVVLDPFAGSASTLVAANNMGRDFVGFEINPEYHRLANERLASLPPRLI